MKQIIQTLIALLGIYLGFYGNAWSDWRMSTQTRFDKDNQQFFLEIELNSCEWDKVARGNVTQYVQVKNLDSYAANRQYGRWLQVRGKFKPEQQYNLEVDGKICGLNGYARNTVQTPAYPPAVEFLSKGLYFSKVNPHLRFRYRQLDQIKWEIYHIEPHNRYLFSQTENLKLSKLQAKGETDRTQKDFRYFNYLKEYPSTLHKVTTKLKKQKDWAYASLDLTPYYKQGAWLVIVSEQGANKVIQFTNIGLYLRKNQNGVWGQTVQLPTGLPISTTISLKQRNGEILKELDTDENGLFNVSWQKQEKQSWTELQRIEARAGDDSVEIFLKDGPISLSTLPVTGVDQTKSPLQAFVYSDRGLYRLGETVNLGILLRDWEQKLPTGILSAELTLFGPKGKVAHHVLNQFAEQDGGMDWSWKIPHDAYTGRYRAEIKYHGKIIGTGQFSIEQIIPPSIEGELVLDGAQKFWDAKLPGAKPVTGTVKSRFLFGAPASGKQWEYRCILEKGQLQAPGFEGFVFNDSLRVFPAKTFAQADKLQLDNNGQGAWQCLDEGNLSKEQIETKLTGVGKLKVMANVFEEGGRSINIVQSVPAYFHPVYPGIKPLFEGNLDYKEAASFQLVAIDPRTGQATPGVKLKVELWEKDYWGWYYFHSRDEEVVDSELTRVLTSSKTIVSKTEPVLFSITPPHCCDWELRVSIEGSDVSSRVAFRNGWWGEDSGLTSSLSQKITFTTDKEKYAVGDVAHILVTAPFDGELLLLHEKNGRAFQRDQVKVVNRKAEYTLEVTEDHTPWFRLNGILLRTLSDSKEKTESVGYQAKRETPYRALGMLPIQADNPQEFLDFQLTMPEEGRPESNFPLSIQVLDQYGKPLIGETWLTVSVVDEGILNLINFQTPDPYAGLHRRPAYPNQWFDTMGLVIPYSLHQGISAFGAGDNLLDLLKQVKRIQPMSWWSGVVKTDLQGQLALQVPINDYTGRVRVMVAGWQKHRTGSVEKSMPVLAPVDLLTSLPRVFGASDQSQAVAEVFNNTDQPQQIEVTLEIDGPLSLLEKEQPLQTILIPENQSKVIHWKLKGQGIPGIGSLRFSAKNERSDSRQRVTQLAIRPVTAPQEIAETFLLKPGESLDHFPPENLDFLPNTGQWEVMLSSSPVIRLGKHLKNVVSYPYGCAEQTTSRLLAMLLLRPVLGEEVLVEYVGDKKAGQMDNFIREGIKKLQNMQMADGGFAYWTGGNYQYSWINAYVTHFLWEAQRQNYAVPKKMYQAALKKIKTQSHARNAERLDVAAYSTFVLALNGQINKSDLQNLLSELRSRQRKHELLRSAVATIFMDGAARRAGYFLPVSLLQQFPSYDLTTSRQQWWQTHHFLSVEGSFAVKLYGQSMAGNKGAVPASLQFIDHLNNQRYFSTHTLAWTLLAFNSLFPTSDAGAVSVTAPNGKVQQLSTVASKNRVRGNLATDSIAPLSITNASEKNNVFGSLIYRGYPTQPPQEDVENQIELTRHYFTEDGQQLNPPFSVSQGTRLFAVITARHTAPSLKNLSNVVVEDWLPAGFELENQRLSKDASLPLLPKETISISPWTVDYVDYGDDKIAIFGTLHHQFQVFVYPVRAVSQGTFRLMPLQAEAMYIPEINALHVQEGEVTVTSPMQ